MKFVLRIQRSKGSGLWRTVARYTAIGALIAGTLPAATRPAQALFGATKSLTIQHMHTGETATITFKRSGVYDQQALQKLNWMLRDWRTDEPTKMDPRLFDLLAEVYDESGSHQPIRVVSAYRSPGTNAMLRRRSKMVAEHSQHMLGKAMDFYLTDVSPDKLRAIGMKLQVGGVGFYPNNPTHFTHLDVGGVRSWPRMTRTQLANLFPDGKTVHLPADGRPLSGYEEAKAMILARGGKVAGEQYAVADASASSGSGKSFWSRLFGGSDEEEDQEVPAPSRSRMASRNAPVQQVADDNTGDRPVNFFTRTPPRNFGDDAPVAQQPASERTPVRVAAAPVYVQTTSAPIAPIPAPSVPVPPVRQVATLTDTPRGPQMVWQAGAPGQTSDPFKAVSNTGKTPFTPSLRPGTETTAMMAYAPLPPLRPGVARKSADLADQPIITGSLPHAPLPPVRPDLKGKQAAIATATAKTPAKLPSPRKAAAKPTGRNRG